MKINKFFIFILIALSLLASFIVHHKGLGTIYENIFLCISFLAIAYSLFYNSFISELGKETAQLAVLEKKTETIEQIGAAYKETLEIIKANLEKRI